MSDQSKPIESVEDSPYSGKYQLDAATIMIDGERYFVDGLLTFVVRMMKAAKQEDLLRTVARPPAE